MEERADKRGRKAQMANPGERVSLGLKVTPEIKNKLDHQAKRNGRTQSQEAESRLDRSFDRQDLIEEVMELKYGNPLAGILMAIGVAIEKAGRAAALYSQLGAQDRRTWVDDPFAYDQGMKAAVDILDRLRPPGDIVAPSKFKNASKIGSNVAAEIIDEIISEAPIFPDLNPHDADTARLRRALSSIAQRARTV
jgi:hypothetical protein